MSNLSSGAPIHQAEQAWNHQQLSVPVTGAAHRLWTYPEPAVVLGHSQRKLATAEQSRLRAGIDLTWRHAGGGAVLVGPWMLGASIVLSVSHPLVTASTVQSYRWLGELFVELLKSAGIAADALNPKLACTDQVQDKAPGAEWACYGGTSPWEAVVADRKIVGLAQVRRRTGILLVAGLLLDSPDWSLLCRALDRPQTDAALLARRTTSCFQELGRALPPSFVSALDHALERAIALA